MPTVCEEHGIETQLRCATCEKPICQKCLVETRVGFKCFEHGRFTAAPPKADGGRAPPPRRGGGGEEGGGGGRMGFFPFLLVAFIVFPVLTIGFGALFAVTADKTGFVALLPLLAVFALLIGGTILLARRIMRS